MEPIFTDPDLPRYTQSPFPAYRFLPFRPDIPHPRNDPDGHSYGQEEDYLPHFSATDWPTCTPYLYAIDLFNHGYWWEAHEAWEPVWQAAGQQTLCGQFVQGLIQLAGSQLKRYTGTERGARILTETGVAKLSLAEGIYLGIEIEPFIAAAERCLREDRGEFPRIKLHFPAEQSSD